MSLHGSTDILRHYHVWEINYIVFKTIHNYFNFYGMKNALVNSE